MKRKIVAFMLAMAMTVSATACGASKTEEKAETTQSSAASVDAEKYVKLCDLDKLEVTYNTYTFTDQDVEDQVKEMFEYYVDTSDTYNYTDITDRTDVQDGDFCNIDYEGKKDGVAFDGGTAQGYNLEIGSGTFIDGFEEGLKGHNVGEELDLNLTFPESYGNADLAGQAVVFHVKINKIAKREMPEMTDESVKALDMDYDSVEAMRKETKDQLQESCDTEMETSKKDALWAAIMEQSEVTEVPGELLETFKEQISKNAKSYADNYGVELEEFVKNYMQMDMDSFNKEIENSATDAAKESMVLEVIAKKAKLEVTEDEIKSRAEAEYADYSYDSADAFLEEVGKESFRQYLLQEKVDEYLNGIVKFTAGEELNIVESYNSPDASADEELELDEEDFGDEEEIVIDGDDVEEEDNVLTEDGAAEAEEEAEDAEDAEDAAAEDAAAEEAAEDGAQEAAE